MHWKLEDYIGEKMKIGDKKYQKLFDPNTLQNKIIHTSGSKLAFLIAILGEYLECKSDDYFESTKDITKQQVFDLPFMKWLQDVVMDIYRIELDYNSDCEIYPFIEPMWFDESPFDVLGPVMNETLKSTTYIIDCKDNEEIVKKVLKDIIIFKAFVNSYLTNKDLVIIDEFEEW
jgi:hypothetical protein